MTFEFTLVLDGELTAGVVNALHEAGCSDAVFGSFNGVPEGQFTREADTARAAITSAMRQVESTGLRVMSVVATPRERAGADRRTVDGKPAAADDPERSVWWGCCYYWTDDWSLLDVGTGRPRCPECGAPGYLSTMRAWEAARRQDGPVLSLEIAIGYERCPRSARTPEERLRPEHLGEEALRLLRACLYEQGEPNDDRIEVVAIVHTFYLHPGRLEAHREEVRAMLRRMPEGFHRGAGGGWTFLNMCEDRDGAQWGQHHTMEVLVALGMALGYVRFCAPRELWPAFPGGMPYVVIDAERAFEGYA